MTAEKWVYGGQALGRAGGQVVLTPFAMPGESLRVAQVRARSGMIEARLEKVLTPAVDRIEPRCPLFARCGGCDYQHAPYEFQLARKVEILREVFRRIGKFDAPEEIRTVSAEPWAYRNRAQFHLQNRRIGYQEAGSHKLVPVTGECPIAASAINQALTRLRDVLHHRRWPQFIHTLELFTNGAQTLVNIGETEGGQRVARPFFDWLAERIPGANLGELNYAAGGRSYRVSHGSFFQTNRLLVDALIEEALRHVGGETALELYAGVGLFTLPLAARVPHVDAVESSSSAVRDLSFNLEQAGLNANAHRSNADLYLEKLATTPGFVLADPPRSGLGKAVVQHLARLAPPRITIVSCDPSTQARDLAVLLAAGYRIRELVFADLFPQTYHLETIAHLELSPG